MISGSCHCGAVRFELIRTPDWLTDCNCSICRRLGTLWAHADASDVRLNAAPGATIAYSWGDHCLAFHSCRTCGCTTHWSSLDDAHPDRMAVNCRLADPSDIAALQVRRFDGADSWTYLD